MKKYTIRIIFCAILLLMCITLSSCSSAKKDIVGSEKIEKFRKEASEYSSARIFVTNTVDDKLERVFTYYYKDDGTMVYLTEEQHGDAYSAEYNDGENLYTKSSGETQVIPKGSEDFISYSKKEKHPYADSQLFFYVDGFINTAAETVDENGNQIYNYFYDVAKMNKQLDSNLTKFETSYVFDKDGKFLYFAQSNSSAADGTTYDYAYMIEIAEINNIKSIDNSAK